MTTERCPSCSLDLAAAWCASAHHTADGVVRYLRCPCGTWTVIVAGGAASIGGPVTAAGCLRTHSSRS